mmetsp:Transcript_1258/g.1692  ORF Transcript_1258/g.1692 Transcript_1258/m.1692 type:complete len:95 (-) Transcript_1258:28-312(-)
MTPTLNSSLQISGWSAGGGADVFGLECLDVLGVACFGLDSDFGADFLWWWAMVRVSPGERCSRASKSAMSSWRWSIVGYYVTMMMMVCCWIVWW